MGRNDHTFSSAELAGALLDLAATPARSRRGTEVAIERLCAFPPPVVLGEAERRLRRMIAAAWSSGWQPAEIERQIRRNTDATGAQLGLVAIAADHAGRAPSTLDARWVAQLTALALPPVAEGDGWISHWAEHERLTWPEQVAATVAVLASLAPVSRIQILIPPPGARTGHDTIIDLVSTADDPMLNRIRALLAQAESTNYEAEAETFTAKAQALMTRHAIDMAMVSAGAQRSERPGTIRVPIDEPYVDAKSLLLQIVAESSRCRAVFHLRFAMSSVIGFAADIAATETLFTSLLVQAQVAMQAAATSAPPGTRARSRSFRSAFLTAYAHRVAERLAEINAYVVAEAEAQTGRSILPVLATRSSIVDETVGEMFGRLTSTGSRRGHDAAGWASGRMAADRARLNPADLARPARTLAAP